MPESDASNPSLSMPVGSGSEPSAIAPVSSSRPRKSPKPKGLNLATLVSRYGTSKSAANCSAVSAGTMDRNARAAMTRL